MHAKEAVVVLSLVAFLPPEIGYSQEFGTGAIFLPPQEYNALRSAPAIIRDAPIPGNIDLADRFPSPGNQGLQASCVGWAVAYTKAYLENLERLEQGSSPVMYSPSFIFNQIKIDCFSGSYISDAVELIKRQGAVNIHEFVYNERDCGRKPTAETLSIASRTKALNWGRIKNANETLELAIRKRQAGVATSA